ncbi:hypothetical protein CKO28_12400 [Rhodovibrio sodomensis]|uniref:Uncharacterized protein n=1 Tax=Rhodovibrio sodomensis TaxID=1088 RepID=A0ABS1DEE1_9PROT|nr:hypothetical protein [Rhodovibrio sodomensis]
MALVTAACFAGPVRAQERYADHVIDSFEKDVLRAFDPVRRVPADRVRVRDIQQTERQSGTVVKMRSVDDLVCLKLKPGTGREEACVLAADLSPCVCDYEVADIPAKQSQQGGLAGVVMPNGGSCSCK